MKNTYYLFTFFFVSLFLKENLSLWPKPRVESSSKKFSVLEVPLHFTYKLIKSEKCSKNINYLINHYKSVHFGSTTNDLFGKKFRITRNTNKNLPVFEILINDCSDSMNMNTSEGYFLELNEFSFKLKAETYFGAVRGIDTFFQLLHPANNKISKLKIPVRIEDSPEYSYRGLMLDTSRHFLTKSEILKTIEAMMYNKLNVLHLHLTDSDSFPLELDNYPEMAKTGAFSSNQVYSKSDINEIVKHGLKCGVRVIPELDTPGHARSWGLSKKYENIAACTTQIGNEWAKLCVEPPCGQLDPTLSQTYEVVNGVFKEIQEMFPDEFIHLGGDEVSFNCWKNKTSIHDWMVKNGISSYQDLEIMYRNKQRKLVNKTSIYWFQNLNIPINSNDIGQYWGTFTGKETFLKDINFKMISSPYNHLYLDCGIESLLGVATWCNPYATWKSLYNFDPLNYGILDKSQVIGAEAVMFGEMVNSNMLDARIWPRLSAFAEVMWSGKSENTLDVARRLVQMAELLTKRGFNVSPVTTQYCSLHLEQCF